MGEPRVKEQNLKVASRRLVPKLTLMGGRQVSPKEAGGV